MKPRGLLFGIGVLALALWAPHAWADIYLVVNRANATQLSKKDVLALYTGRARTFPGGSYALVFDMPRDSGERARFYQQLTGMSLAQINSYWSRLMFTGQTMPPPALPDEATVVQVVKSNPSAIGYLTHEPNDKALSVALVLREAP